jgi:hypothetical protein
LRADEYVDQKLAQTANLRELRPADFEQHLALFRRLVHLPRVKACRKRLSVDLLASGRFLSRGSTPTIVWNKGSFRNCFASLPSPACVLVLFGIVN